MLMIQMLRTHHPASVVMINTTKAKTNTNPSHAPPFGERGRRSPVENASGLGKATGRLREDYGKPAEEEEEAERKRKSATGKLQTSEGAGRLPSLLSRSLPVAFPGGSEVTKVVQLKQNCLCSKARCAKSEPPPKPRPPGQGS